jgi:hypothetical protein
MPLIPKPILSEALGMAGRFLIMGAGTCWILLTLYQSTLWIVTGKFPRLIMAGTSLPMLFLSVAASGVLLCLLGRILRR